MCWLVSGSTKSTKRIFIKAKNAANQNGVVESNQLGVIILKIPKSTKTAFPKANFPPI